MDSLRLSRVAILGVGAVGSLVADLLVRGGVQDMLLVDEDTLAIGNLVRHRLRMEHLAESKSTSLGEELNLSSPHARVRAHPNNLPWSQAQAQALLEDRTIVIDCTGDDGPLRALARCSWTSPKLFASVSVGPRAAQLYFFTARDVRFPFEAFEASVKPWLDRARGLEGEDLPWEGAGCWHPVWPGRLDDLMLMTATASKLLETAAREPGSSPGLQVFERQTGPDGTFEGLRRAELLARAEGRAA